MSVPAPKQSEEFSLVAIEQPELRDIVRDNLSDIRIQFERVKIPAGGGLAFEVTDEDGNIQTTPEIVGIILDRYPVNAYWPEKFSGAKNPPQCVALDGKFGVGNPGGDCSRCPNNQWGSDDAGRGKACKNLHRLYVLPPGEVLPLLIALPPTSLANFNAYMLRLTSKAKKAYWSVVTRIKLERATNASGIAYSRATFSRAGDVPAHLLPGLKAYIEQMRPLMRAVEVVADEYGGEEDSGGGQGEASKEPF